MADSRVRHLVIDAGEPPGPIRGHSPVLVGRGGPADGLRCGGSSRSATGAVGDDEEGASGHPDLGDPAIAEAGPGFLRPPRVRQHQPPCFRGVRKQGLSGVVPNTRPPSRARVPEPHNVIFIVGEQTGCRVGEILGMQWRDIDLPGRKIHVRQQMQDGKLCILKDRESRIVPLQDSLAPILEAWKLKTGGVGPLFTPSCPTRGGRPDLGSPAQFIRPGTIRKALAAALAACELPKMTLYQCTRHTFASQWVMNGGNLEVLAKIMGHSSTSTTQHYAHLAPDFFGAKAFDMVAVDLSKPASLVLSLRDVPGPLGQRMGRTQHDNAEEKSA